MERHGVASGIGKSLEYQEKIIAEFFKNQKRKTKHPNTKTKNPSTRMLYLKEVVILLMSVSARTSHHVLMLLHKKWILLSCLSPSPSQFSCSIVCPAASEWVSADWAATPCLHLPSSSWMKAVGFSLGFLADVGTKKGQMFSAKHFLVRQAGWALTLVSDSCRSCHLRSAFCLARSRLKL